MDSVGEEILIIVASRIGKAVRITLSQISEATIIAMEIRFSRITVLNSRDIELSFPGSNKKNS